MGTNKGNLILTASLKKNTLEGQVIDKLTTQKPGDKNEIMNKINIHERLAMKSGEINTEQYFA